MNAFSFFIFTYSRTAYKGLEMKKNAHSQTEKCFKHKTISEERKIAGNAV